MAIFSVQASMEFLLVDIVVRLILPQLSLCTMGYRALTISMRIKPQRRIRAASRQRRTLKKSKEGDSLKIFAFVSSLCTLST